MTSPTQDFRWGDDCPVHVLHHWCLLCRAVGSGHRQVHLCACRERMLDEQQALHTARQLRGSIAMLLGIGLWVAAAVDPLLGVVVGAYAAYVVTRPLHQFRPIFLPELMQQVAAMRARGQWW